MNQLGNKIRNIAIIAHIDHGKTTLLDNMLKDSHIFRDNEKIPERVMDSYDQEQERGITIFSKHTSIYYNDYKINIIDTPGHADFSGEVERVLGMVDSVLLLVDAQEGPMPQTRFVLSKALKMGIKPIVVVNKIDRPHANPDNALNLTFDLFMELGATDEQLDFKHCYASGFHGYALAEIDDERKDLKPLFELIIKAVPAPYSNTDLPFLMQTMTVAYDDFVGRKSCGKIAQGKIKKGDVVTRIEQDGTRSQAKIVRIEGFLGLKCIEMAEACAGDIVLLSGMPEVMLGDTISADNKAEALPKITIEEPTMSIDIMINSSPFCGKDGKHVTMNKIRDRLTQEKRANISLKIEESDRENIKVSGRGELHLAVLIEAMRRENYELSISKPQVIIKEIDGVKHEPIERVHIEVPQDYSGTIIDDISQKKGEMLCLSTNEYGITKMEFLVPTRGLIGYRNEFLTKTRGLGILTAIFEDFAPWKGNIPKRKNGVLISIDNGKATGYACFNLQSRGKLFLGPTTEVYEGMVVGENNRDNDMIVNITREKKLTNVRASGTDEHLTVIPHIKMTLENAIDFIEEDEIIEITPHHIRIRKRILKECDRKRKQ